MILAIIGLLLGIALGLLFPWSIPVAYSKLFSIALLGSLDSVFGGLRAACEGTFDDKIFISGFFLNAILAVFLVYVGEHLGIDLYYVALLALGFRIFNNMGHIRRYMLKKH